MDGGGRKGGLLVMEGSVWIVVGGFLCLWEVRRLEVCIFATTHF